MKINPFANGAIGIAPGHRLHYNVNVTALTDPVNSVAMAGLDEGNLSCYTNFGKELWVCDAQLAAVVGFGWKLFDPSSPYFVPPEAMIKPAFWRERIEADAPDYQLKALEDARIAADYLAELGAAMPPRPYDLHVHRRTEGTPLARMVQDGRLDTHPSERGWWVISAEVIKLLPAGESLEDPESSWYVSPRDWADQDEVDRFIEEHRRNWPEIYDPATDLTSEVPASV